MITKLREKRRGQQVLRVEVCETCGVACDAGCQAVATREVVVDRVLVGGLWR